MAKNKSSQVALSGVMGALCIATMFLGSIIPMATFVAPAIAGVFVALVAIEMGTSTGFLMYCAVSFISALIVPEKEMSMIFLFFLGFYPLVKTYFDKMSSSSLRMLAKLALFNICIVTMYSLLIYVFPIAVLQSEFSQYAFGMILALLALANITFLVYDLALTKFLRIYMIRIRPRIMKGSS